MLLRICLVIAILAGAGVIAVSHFKVRPHLEGIIEQREKNAKDRDTEKAAKVKAQGELKATTAKLKETESTLAETQTQLTAAKQQADAEQKRANNLKEKLAKAEQDFNESQQKLSRWDLIGLDPSQVKTVIDNEKNLRLANQALDEEKKFFAKKFAETERRLKEVLGNDNPDPPMTPGLKGKVLVVDPKWSFVVLDIGEKHGAVQNGVLMISRNSKLVAKVRIMNLQAERSIANIMPGWKLAEVMEGDYALY